MRIVDRDEVRRILAERPAGPATPAKWTGAHVGVRLVDAFKVLVAVEPSGGPKLAQVFIEIDRNIFTEELLQLQLGETVCRPTRRRPSARDIRLMEDAIGWPVRYLPDQATRHIVMIWAHGAAIGKPAGRMRYKAWMRYGLTKAGFDRGRLAGCMAIAIGLQRDRVLVE